MKSTWASRVVRPSILYFGTPVALVSTQQPDGSANLSPMSSVWALAQRLVLGLGEDGQCLANLRRTRQAVVNLPSEELATQVERIARATGRDPVPPAKAAMGYCFEADKFGLAGLTPLPADCVAPPRVAECPLQLECELLADHAATPTAVAAEPGFAIVELAVLRVHAHDTITVAAKERIDPARWHPLFYVFRHYYGLGAQRGQNFRAEV